MSALARNPHRGTSLEDFLDEEGIREEAAVAAVKRVIAWQLKQEMEKRKLTKTGMGRLMETSRSQLDRALDPEDGSVTLDTLQRAAAFLGRKLRLELA